MFVCADNGVGYFVEQTDFKMINTVTLYWIILHNLSFPCISTLPYHSHSKVSHSVKFRHTKVRFHQTSAGKISSLGWLHNIHDLSLPDKIQFSIIGYCCNCSICICIHTFYIHNIFHRQGLAFFVYVSRYLHHCRQELSRKIKLSIQLRNGRTGFI